MVLYAASPTSFTCREARLALAFATGGDAGAAGVMASLSVGGQTFHATRQ
jgi:hypothetical protein